MPELINSEDSYEMILPRLGDYLLKEGLITSEGLQQALEYQKTQQAAGQSILLGQAILALGLIDAQLLDKAITRQVLDLHAILQKNNQLLEDRVQQRTQDLERRLLQIRTAAEITQFAISAASFNELLKRSVNLIVERFGYYSASIFLVDQSSKNLVLAEAAGPFSLSIKQKGQVIPVGSRSMVGWVAAYNQPRVSADVRQEFFYHMDDLLTDTRSEASIPISLMNLVADVQENRKGSHNTSADAPGLAQVLGVLDVQHNTGDAFDPDVVAVLQTIANHIASVMQNFYLLDSSRQRLNEISTLYNASHRLSQAKSPMEVYAALGRTLEEGPFPAALLVASGNEMRPYSLRTGRQVSRVSVQTEEVESFPDSNLSKSQLETLFPVGANLLVVDLTQPITYPQPIMNMLHHLECDSVALIPINQSDHLAGLIFLGFHTRGKNNELDEIVSKTSPVSDPIHADAPVLQSYVGLAQLTATALEKVNAVTTVERRMGALQALNTISQLVSARTNLNELYRRIHSEIMQLMGNIDFIIALYDEQANTIRIPYMVEIDSNKNEMQSISVPPFSLGQGLTSIIINTRQSLMLNFDTVNRAKELGAIVLGQPARSWLGAPLLFASEPLGAIIVQDREHEGRFTEDDQRLLETLAAQVAISIHTTRLLESTSQQAERERLLYEITSKIRSSTDMQSIIEITAMELQKAFNAQRARIDIDVDTALQSTHLESQISGRDSS